MCLERVTAVIQRMGSCMKDNKIIGICASGLQREDVTDMLKSICAHLEGTSCQVDVYGTFVKMDRMDAYARGEAQIYENMDVSDMELLIVLGESISNEVLIHQIVSKAQAAGIPVISVEYQLDGCYNVIPDYQSTFRKIVEHVIVGHQVKNPYFMAGFKGMEFSEQRLDIFKSVLKEQGIPFRREHMGYGDFWDEPARKLCEQWLDREDDQPDAIICANDLMALEVCNVLKEHGLRVPEDVIVTGFDGYELVDYCSPRLTTATMDVDAVGTTVREMAGHILTGDQTKPYTKKIPFYASFSQSCGCEKAQKIQTNNQIMSVYKRMRRAEYEYTDTFMMMNTLTEGHSMMEMFDKALDLMSGVRLNDMVLYVNRRFCHHTDIPVSRGFKPGAMLMLLESKDGKIHKTFEVIDNQQELAENSRRIITSSQILHVPVHWQEEEYGMASIAITPDLQITRLSHYMLGLTQVMGTVRKQSQLYEMYMRDPMTDLYNRRGFFAKLNQAMREIKDANKICFLASIDMDGLKYINDNYGHSEGDYALKVLGECLEETVGDDGICARFGGDEFMVVCVWPKKTAPKGFEKPFKKQFEALLRRRQERTMKDYPIGVSIGCVSREIVTVSEVDEMMREADDSMYRIKENHHHVRLARRD